MPLLLNVIWFSDKLLSPPNRTLTSKELASTEVKKYSSAMNPLTPSSDKHVISPNSVTLN